VFFHTTSKIFLLSSGVNITDIDEVKYSPQQPFTGQTDTVLSRLVSTCFLLLKNTAKKENKLLLSMKARKAATSCIK